MTTTEPTKESKILSRTGLVVIIFCIAIGAVICSGCVGSSGSSHYQVKVTTPGEWGGTVSTEGSHKTLSGTGTTTIEMKDPRIYLSVTVWKKDNSTEDMLLEVVKDGNVIKSDETNFKHGHITIYTPV